ncbi:hypothetical protein BH23PLA1_BH23PLA1_21040 [soil metagenome]
MHRILGFWLDRGVSGFRIDAAHYIVESRQAEIENLHSFLADLRKFVESRNSEAILMAEAEVPERETMAYFNEGDQAHIVINFLMNQSMFLAMARQQAEPLAQRLRTLPEPPPGGQWANFVRNHDELSLGLLTDAERAEVFDAFGPEESMQLFGRGIRRRPAPMFGDRRQMELAYSLLLTLPGTPIIGGGEEIGMGEDLSQPGRQAVRTPMQWNAGPSGGFSTARPEDLSKPITSGGEFGSGRVNVETQRQDPGSLLNWMIRAIGVRKTCPEFGHGLCTPLDPGAPEVLATLHQWRDRTLITLHNLADRPATATLDRSACEGQALADLFDDLRLIPAPDVPYRIELEGYGYRWFRVD